MPDDLDTKPAALRTRRAIINLLKRRNPQDAGQLAAELGVSSMAVRQHLYALRDEKLATFEEQVRPRGRPAKLWRLTPDADAFFPDGHAELSVDLIASITKTFGPEGLDKLLAVRARDQIAAYRERVKASDPLGKRLRALARIRGEEGYMAEARKAEDGGFLLVENHCPVCSAAKACTGICAAELEVFREVLGRDVTVERCDHILAGARRCAYRVSPIGNRKS